MRAFEFPSRHCKYEVPILALEKPSKNRDRYYPMDASERKCLLEAVICCFDGRKPYVVSTHRGLLDDISEDMSDFLSEVKFFSCLICDPSTELSSLEMALKGPTSLEILMIHNSCDVFICQYTSIDSVFSHITNQLFLASLRILVVGAGDYSYFKFP